MPWDEIINHGYDWGNENVCSIKQYMAAMENKFVDYSKELVGITQEIGQNALDIRVNTKNIAKNTTDIKNIWSWIPARTTCSNYVNG